MARVVSLTRLWRNTRGVAALEFALILPVLLLMFFGIIETAMVIFLNTTIESAVSQSARYGITGPQDKISRTDKILQIIATNTYGLVDMKTVHIDTLIYDSFANIGKPEPFTDKNGNHHYDSGEPFTDVNGSGLWEADMGKAGLGGGDAIVVYSVRYAWGIMTPMLRQVMGDDVELVSSVAVRNEPFK